MVAFRFWCSLILLHGAAAFEWTFHRKNGSTIHQCSGNNVTFPWTYITRNEEKVIAIFWFSDKNGTIVTWFGQRFVTSSDRVTFVPNAGINLSTLTKDDSGMYGASVLLNVRDIDAHHHVVVNNLVVVELPEVTDGRLRIGQLQPHQALANEQDSSQPPTQLSCGHFHSLGIPPVSVTWTDPDDHQKPSTDYNDGYYLLNLPANYKGGNYTCSFKLEEEASKCVGNDHPLNMSASIFIETTEEKVKRQEEQLLQLQTEVMQINAKTTALEEDSIVFALTEIQDKISILESNITRDVESKGTQELNQKMDEKVQFLRESFLKAIEDLQTKTEQSLTQKLSGFSTELRRLSSSLATQLETFTDQQHTIVDLGNQLEGQQNMTTRLQSDLASALHSLSEQNCSELRANVSGVFRRLEDKEDLTTHLQSDLASALHSLSEQKAISASLQANLSGVFRRLEDKEDLTTHLQSDLASALHSLSEQKAISASLQANVSGVFRRLEDKEDLTTRLQSDLASALHSLSEQNFSELRANVSGVFRRLEDKEDLTTHLQSELASALHSLSEQKTISASLQANVSGVFRRLEDKEDLTTHLQSELASALHSLNEQKAISASLQANVSGVFRRLEDKEDLTTRLQSDLASALHSLSEQNFSELRANVSGVFRRLEDKEDLTTRLQSELASALHSLSEQKAISASLQANVSGVFRRLEDKEDLTTHLQSELASALHSLSEQKAISASLQANVSGVFRRLEDKEDLTTHLQSDLASALHSLSEQKAISASLQAQLLEVQEKNAQQNQNQSEQAKVLAELRANATAVFKRLEDEETFSQEMRQTLADQQRTREEQTKAFAQGNKRITDEHLRGLHAVQNQLEDLKVNTNNLNSRLNNSITEQTVRVLGIQRNVTHLQSSQHDLIQETHSKLVAFQETLVNIHNNLTGVVTAVQSEQTALERRFRTECETQSTLTQQFQTNLTRFNSTMTSVRSLINSTQSEWRARWATVDQIVSNASTSLTDRLLLAETQLRDVEARIYPIRLVGGRNSSEGRVEIRLGNGWGTICDDGWDEKDAKVVCAMLGYFQDGAKAVPSAGFGVGTGPIVLDDVSCVGTEPSILACPSRAFGIHNCGHQEDAGVVCTA